MKAPSIVPRKSLDSLPRCCRLWSRWYAPNKTDKEIILEGAEDGRRKDVSLEEKVSLVEEYLAGRLRLREAARRAGVGHTTMEIWISRYRSEGISALEENGNQW